MKVGEWEGTVEEMKPFDEGALVWLEGPFKPQLKKGDRIRVEVEWLMNDYPGQGYFHRHNANIKAAEERWERAHRD
jgi:hypothetical protein